MFLIIFLLGFLVNYCTAENEFQILPIVKFYISPPKICNENSTTWKTIESKIIFEMKKIKYFKVFHYKFDSENITDLKKIYFEIKNCESNKKFIIQVNILDNKKKYSREFKIENDYNLSNFQYIFIEYLTSIFPLTGVVLSLKDKNFITINLGKNYDINNNDEFLILNDNDKVIAAGIATETFENFSVVKIVKNITPINRFYKVRKYDFNLVNKLNSKSFKFIKNNPHFPYEIEKFNSKKFKLFNSENTNFSLITGTTNTIFLNLNNLYIETLEDIGLNNILDSKFSYYNKFCGYILNNQNTKILRVYNLKNLNKYTIFKEKETGNFSLLPYNSNFTPAEISAFTFNKYENFIYFVSENKLFQYDIENKSFKEIQIESRINEIKNIFLSQNDEKIIIETINKEILIKDLLDNTEYLIDSIKWWNFDKTGFRIFYSTDKNNLNIYNIYSKDLSNIYIENLENVTKAKVSYSEEFLALLNNGLVDIYSLKHKIYVKDIFESGNIKLVKDFDLVPGYNFLIIYGQLYDENKNNKIDYIDRNFIVLFDIEERKSYKLLENIEDFNGISADGNFIFITKNNKLNIYQIPYEKLLTEE